MKHVGKMKKLHPVLVSVILGLVVFCLSMSLGAYLIWAGIVGEGWLKIICGVCLFLTVAIGGIPLTKGAKRKLLVALCYSLVWGIVLSAIGWLGWNGDQQGNLWVLIVLFGGAVVAGLLGSRGKKLAY